MKKKKELKYKLLVENRQYADRIVNQDKLWWNNHTSDFEYNQ